MYPVSRYSNSWFSLMILVKDNEKIGQSGGFLPMCYRTNDHFRQGAPVCPNEKRPKTATNQPAFLYHSLPAPTATVAILTASIRATSRGLHGWVRTNAR